jgi:hypothetical protein
MLVSPLLELPMQPARADTGARIVEEVDFATSCSPGVPLVLVSRGVEGFHDVTEPEPDCAIDYGRIAMSHWYPL